jgi:hypothetical protein
MLTYDATTLAYETGVTVAQHENSFVTVDKVVAYTMDRFGGDALLRALGSIGHVDGEGEGIDASPTPTGALHVLSIDVNVVPVRMVDLQVVGTPASR